MPLTAHRPRTLPRRTDDSLHRRPTPAPRHHGTGATAHVDRRPPTTATTSTKDVAVDEAKNVGQTAAQAGSQVASTAADQAKEVAAGDPAPGQGPARPGPHAGQGAGRHPAAEGRPGPDLARRRSCAAWPTAPARAPPAPPATCSSRPRAWSRSSPTSCRTASRPSCSTRSAASPAASRACSCSVRPLPASLAGRLTSGVKAAHADSSSGNGRCRLPRQAQLRRPGADLHRLRRHTTDDPTGSESYDAPAPATPAPRTGTPLPPPPYGTVPPAGSVVPPTTPAGWDDPARRPGGVG